MIESQVLGEAIIKTFDGEFGKSEQVGFSRLKSRNHVGLSL